MRTSKWYLSRDWTQLQSFSPIPRRFHWINRPKWKQFVRWFTTTFSNCFKTSLLPTNKWPQLVRYFWAPVYVAVEFRFTPLRARRSLKYNSGLRRPTLGYIWALPWITHHETSLVDHTCCGLWFQKLVILKPESKPQSLVNRTRDRNILYSEIAFRN